MLTLTYPGWLFGHGFVQGGCALFRNSLYAGTHEGPLPYAVWGLLASHCPTVQDVAALAKFPSFQGAGHVTVADEHGGAIGIESAKGGIAVLKPKNGIYTHANACHGGKRLQKHEQYSPFGQQNSYHRESRLYELLATQIGHITAQQCLYALADHVKFPHSICRHDMEHNGLTTSAVVVEPTKGLLHATRGAPCRNWPKTYRL
jgi:isopenicillin-N N-acyltransferase-like protein